MKKIVTVLLFIMLFFNISCYAILDWDTIEKEALESSNNVLEEKVDVLNKSIEKLEEENKVLKTKIEKLEKENYSLVVTNTSIKYTFISVIAIALIVILSIFAIKRRK